MYKILKPLIFLLPAETAHHMGLFVVRIIGFFHRHGLWQRPRWATDMRLETPTPFGKVASPLGLAPGFDKNARALWGWQALGFAFVEVGTITPLPQPGNEKPRMFRFPKIKGIVNRLGFNNDGALVISNRIKKARAQGLRIKIGGNIGKNFSTPIEHAAMDYRKATMQVQSFVDYLVINVSSPNTPGLRDMQAESFLDEIVTAVKLESGSKPIFIKLAPDSFEEFKAGVLKVFEKHKLAGLICGNTLANHAAAKLSNGEVISLPKGGLSGEPIFENNFKLAESYSQYSIYLVGVGGITSPERALEYLNAGCRLIQIYTGFVYGGPDFIKQVLTMILTQKTL